MGRSTLTLVAILAAIAGSCGGGGGGEDSGTDVTSLRVLATDAPFPYDDVLRAIVRVRRIELHDADADAFLTLVDFTASGGRLLDLVELRNGVTEELFAGDPDPGTYDQVRIVVEAVEIAIDDDGAVRTFTDFVVPSGEQTGIKVHVDPAIEVSTSLTRDLLLDFDLARSFVVQGNPATPAGIKGFHFKPVVRAVNVSTAGSLRFRVMSDNGTPGTTADDVFLDGASYEVRTGDTVVASGASDTTEGVSGLVFHPAIPAGGHELEVEADGHDEYRQGVAISAANLTDLGTILLARSLTEIEGVVTTEIETIDSGTLAFAVAGAFVAAAPAGGGAAFGPDTTTTLGEYRLTGIPTGTYVLEVSRDGYETATRQTVLDGGGSAEEDFVLVAKTASVTGTVRDEFSNPVSGAAVRVLVDHGGDWRAVAEGTSGADGTFALAGVPTGDYAVRATTAEATPRTGETLLEHTGGGTASSVDLVVR